MQVKMQAIIIIILTAIFYQNLMFYNLVSDLRKDLMRSNTQKFFIHADRGFLYE